MGEEKQRESQVFCLRTQHNDSARSRTQTSRPDVQPIGHCVFHFTLEYKGLGRVVQSKIQLTEGHPTIFDSVLLLYRQFKQFVLFSSVLLYTIVKLFKTWAVIYPKFNEKYRLNQFFESWITANRLLKNRPLNIRIKRSPEMRLQTIDTWHLKNWIRYFFSLRLSILPLEYIHTCLAPLAKGQLLVDVSTPCICNKYVSNCEMLHNCHVCGGSNSSQFRSRGRMLLLTTRPCCWYVPVLSLGLPVRSSN